MKAVILSAEMAAPLSMVTFRGCASLLLVEEALSKLSQLKYLNYQVNTATGDSSRGIQPEPPEPVGIFPRIPSASPRAGSARRGLAPGETMAGWLF